MFSLIITIISVALVAALALATLYYGGDAFNKGRADAKAAQLLVQGQQLLAATDMYKVNHGVFPPNKQALVDGGYLKAVPLAQGEAASSAWAENEEWEMPLPGVPVFVLPATEEAPCKRVNFRSYRMDGILKEVNESIAAQCYGTSTYKTVVAKSGTNLTVLAGAVTAGDPSLDPTVPLTPTDFGSVETTLPDPGATDPSTGPWSVAPGTEVADGGGSNGGSNGGSPESLAKATFTLTQTTPGHVSYAFTSFEGADITPMAPGRLEILPMTDGELNAAACDWYVYDSQYSDGMDTLAATAECDYSLGKPNSLLQDHTGAYFTVSLNGIGGWAGTRYGQPTFLPSGAVLANQPLTGQSQYQWCVTFDTSTSPWNLTASQTGACVAQN